MRKEILYLIMTVIGGGILLGSTIFVLVMWPHVPDQIPTHFNLAGEADSYGGKGQMIMLIVLAWVMFIAMTVLVKFPNRWNIPVKVTAENRARLYAITRGMLEIVKLLATLLLSTLFISITIAAKMPQFITLAFVAALFLTIIIGIYLMFKNR